MVSFFKSKKQRFVAYSLKWSGQSKILSPAYYCVQLIIVSSTIPGYLSTLFFNKYTCLNLLCRHAALNVVLYYFYMCLITVWVFVIFLSIQGFFSSIICRSLKYVDSLSWKNSNGLKAVVFLMNCWGDSSVLLQSGC